MRRGTLHHHHHHCQTNEAKSFRHTNLLWNPVGPASKLPDKLALMQEPAIAWWLAESRSLQQSSRMTPTRSRWLPLALRLFVIPTDISPMLGPMLGLIARCPSVSTTLRVSPAAVTAAQNTAIKANVYIHVANFFRLNFRFNGYFSWEYLWIVR